MATADPARHRLVAQNRKARHDFFIEDTLEAGIMLQGSEVKSLRQGHASIAEAFAVARDGDLVLVNAHIPEYAGANRFNHEPRRPRKLLLHKRELNRLIGQVQRAGVTLVPLAIYFNERGIAKVSLGVAKGKRRVDKREAEKARDWQRDKARLMRERG
ncbi:MAG: SsrA-binding protein SmpB [Rhodospirillaceae bacterium]|nr:SsrA-binding protein SmpB [Rhodospirillaceae bacterium]